MEGPAPGSRAARPPNQGSRHAPDYEGSIRGDRDDRRRDARARRVRSRSPPSPSARRSRCPISSSCSASCAATGSSTASAGPAAATTSRAAADAISVADVILAVDEPIDATQCAGRENCLDDRRCMTHELWAGLNAHIFAYLRSVTLAELVRQQTRAVQRRPGRDARPPSAEPALDRARHRLNPLAGPP